MFSTFKSALMCPRDVSVPWPIPDKVAVIFGLIRDEVLMQLSLTNDMSAPVSTKKVIGLVQNVEFTEI